MPPMALLQKHRDSYLSYLSSASKPALTGPVLTDRNYLSRDLSGSYILRDRNSKQSLDLVINCTSADCSSAGGARYAGRWNTTAFSITMVPDNLAGFGQLSLLNLDRPTSSACFANFTLIIPPVGSAPGAVFLAGAAPAPSCGFGGAAWRVTSKWHLKKFAVQPVVEIELVNFDLLPTINKLSLWNYSSYLTHELKVKLEKADLDLRRVFILWESNSLSCCSRQLLCQGWMKVLQ